MRVLITGSDGFIGSVMAPLIAAAGHEVVGLDTGLFSACHLDVDADPAPPTLWLDLRDVEPHHLAGFDAVIHLAALSNDPLGDLDPALTYAINLDASVRLAALARDAGVQRFLYSSSCSIYGAAGGDDVLDETAPMRPVTPYAETKVLVEAELHALASADFSPVHLRNATAYGASPRLRTDLVLNDLVASAYLTGEVRVTSDGTPWRPIVHVEDIGRAFLAALEAPREVVHDRAFNVGSDGDNLQIRDLAQLVGEVVPGAEVAITGETGADRRSYRVDFSRITRELPGFSPRWSPRAGAEQLLSAYRHNGVSATQAHERYKRLPWLTRLRDEGRLDAALHWTDAEPSAPLADLAAPAREG